MTPGWACWFTDAMGKEHFGIGVGTIVLTLNAVLPWPLHFRLPLPRHLVGGFWMQNPKRPPARRLQLRECLNTRHMMWAWISLFWVGLADVYVRLCATGHLHDIVFFKF